jgi:replicative DNA helicase
MDPVVYSCEAKFENRVQEISDVTKGLKALAKELEVPVMALSQLSRGVDNRDDKRPVLSDLRESGSIEQDADVVMFIHREDQDEGSPDGEEAAKARTAIPVELIIAKQRNGPVGSIDLVFLSEFTRFESRARGEFQ